MNKELPGSIQSIPVQNPIWGIVINKKDNYLLIDSRNEINKEIFLSTLRLDSFEKGNADIQINWMEKLVGVSENTLFTIQYHDQNDPSRFSFRGIDLDDLSELNLDNQPEFEQSANEPVFYELNTKHHNTVSQFLALELQLPCEYLEFDDNIIISYYLRSEKGFDRFLLLIKGGEKCWKVKQDSNMSGFASGAFFMVDDKLIFVRERNEVCIYTF